MDTSLAAEVPVVSGMYPYRMADGTFWEIPQDAARCSLTHTEHNVGSKSAPSPPID